MNTIALLSVAALTLAGCAQGFRPQDRETPLNWVEFENGVLVRSSEGPNAIACQDYDQRYTLWDRAVYFPKHMHPSDADAVCRSKEQQAFEDGPGTALSGARYSDDEYRNVIANRDVGKADVLANPR